MPAQESAVNELLVAASATMEESGQDPRIGQLPSPAVFDSVPTVREPAVVSAHVQTESVDYFGGMRFPSPSLFDTPSSSVDARYEQAQPPAESIKQQQLSPLPTVSANAVQRSASITSTKTERITLPRIDRWEDLPCIRSLDGFYQQGGVDGRGYHILRRMCQIIWAVGHEVAIRKTVKLPRAQRLAKFQRYFDALYEGAKLWQKNMKARIRHAWDLAFSLPRLDRLDAFQDLEPVLSKWCEATKGLYFPSNEDANLFYYILDHYRNNYGVLYGLHREKPDYGLRDVLPTADKVFKLLIKLPDYSLEADLLIREYELHFSQSLDRYYKDRARQEREIAEFDAMPPEDKQAAFTEYMRLFHPGFVRKVNDAASSPMSHEELNKSLEDFRADFLDEVADAIKHDEFHVEEEEEDDLDDVEYQRMQQLVQTRREARETRQGWIEALGLDPNALPSDDDEDDESAYKEWASEDMPNLESEPLPEDSTFAHLLRKGECHDQRSRGVVYSKRPSGVHDRPKTLPHQAELRGEERDPAFLHDELSRRTAQYQALSPSVDPPGGMPVVDLLSIDGQSSRSEEPTQQVIELSPNPPRLETPTPKMPLHISKSFAAVEDDLVARGHQRSSTVPDASYTTGESTESDPPRPATSFHGRAINTRRHRVRVPRIFTGSFSQLETSIRRLQLDKVNTPEDQPDLSPVLPHAHDCKIRDFAITPQISPSPTPSPATLLFRREALLSKETELQDRSINGQMVRSRRPSTETGAHTVEETTRGLEAWLGDEGRDDSPTLAIPVLARPERKHTI